MRKFIQCSDNIFNIISYDFCLYKNLQNNKMFIALEKEAFTNLKNQAKHHVF